MQRRTLMTTFAAAVGSGRVQAAPAGPVVVELFTSQGCSSCPPADALLTELARDRPDVLALAFHITYWNGLGWPDPFSLEAGTSRQRRYAKLLSTEVYTPQIVVNGAVDVVGSDRRRVLAAIAAGAREDGPAFGVTLRDGAVTITAGQGAGGGEIVLVGYDRLRRTHVARGENATRTLSESNIVRSLATVGGWQGLPLQLTAPLPAGEAVCALLQAPDGRILAAARTD